jgi:hypothetical protein
MGFPSSFFFTKVMDGTKLIDSWMFDRTGTRTDRQAEPISISLFFLRKGGDSKYFTDLT